MENYRTADVCLLTDFVYLGDLKVMYALKNVGTVGLRQLWHNFFYAAPGLIPPSNVRLHIQQCYIG